MAADPISFPDPVLDPEAVRLVHQLRTPASVVLAQAQLLRRGQRGALDAELLERGVAAIESAVARLTALADRLERGERP